jgi:hypothetical protein
MHPSSLRAFQRDQGQHPGSVELISTNKTKQTYARRLFRLSFGTPFSALHSSARNSLLVSSLPMFCTHVFDSAGAGIEPTRPPPAGGVALFTGLPPLAEELRLFFRFVADTKSERAKN